MEGNCLELSIQDFTKDEIDPVHINSVAIDSDTSILISSRHMDEITKIDRRTGDIIWRLGGKKNDFTFINDTIGFSHQHSVSRLKNGQKNAERLSSSHRDFWTKKRRKIQPS